MAKDLLSLRNLSQLPWTLICNRNMASAIQIAVKPVKSLPLSWRNVYGKQEKLTKSLKLGKGYFFKLKLLNFILLYKFIYCRYSLDDVKPKKRTSYRKSELRLLESLEKVCERILSYNLHKERSDSTRFAKGMSQTFKTLHGLVDKGVQVNLGIPYELWDKPPVEVTQLKTQCEDMIEEYEDVIAEWYFKNEKDNEEDSDPDLLTYLCAERVLRNDDERKCLWETTTDVPETKTNKKSENIKVNTRKSNLINNEL